MNVIIKDDFEPKIIIESGQCFRAKKIEDRYFFIHKNHVLTMRKVSEVKWEVSCTAYEWKSIWKPYFDLQRNYKEIRESIPKEDPYLKEAAEYGKGIRILRQDPFEMVLTFLISQRKSIPAIRTAVEKLCQKYGKEIQREDEIYFAFPTPQELQTVTEKELRTMGMGYRAPYLAAAIEVFSKKPSLLKSYENLSDEKLLEELMKIHGIGIKVASCIALFGYGRTALAPVDVWIERVIQEKYNGTNPFKTFGENAGIMQQYMFYYAQKTKNVRSE